MQEISHWLRPHLNAISLAMIATVLVVFGSDVNLWVRKHVRKYHFFVRLVTFILVCAVGYGFASVVLTKVLAKLLNKIGDHYLALVVAAIFLILGLVAEERKQL